MKLYHYIHTQEETGNVVYTVSPAKLTNINNYIELTEDDLQKYELHIRYIEYCSLSSTGELTYDSVKVLSSKLERLSFDINIKVTELRSILVEATAANKVDIVNEISQTIKELMKFINNSDFSGITDIRQIDTITCPELHIDYDLHYRNKIYGV